MLTVILICLFAVIAVFLVCIFILRKTASSIQKGGSFAFDDPARYENLSDLEIVRDEIIFGYQLKFINNYTPKMDKSLAGKHIIVGDIHGSLMTMFIPLIDAGIIKPGSITYQDDHFTYEILPNTNQTKLIYLGDILGRGANRHNLQMLDCMIELSTEYHDRVVFILGNHDLWFINNIYPLADYDFWVYDTKNYPKQLSEKLCKYVAAFQDSIFCVFEGNAKSYICSHTYWNSEELGCGEDFLDDDGRLNTTEFQGVLSELANDCLEFDKLKELVDELNPLLYTPRVGDGSGSIKVDDVVQDIDRDHDDFVWFIGHTQVQHHKHAGRSTKIVDNNGHEGTIYDLDVNTMNNTRDAFADSPDPEQYKRTTERIYYAIVDLTSDQIDFVERYETDDELLSFVDRTDKFLILIDSCGKRVPGDAIYSAISGTTDEIYDAVGYDGESGDHFDHFKDKSTIQTAHKCAAKILKACEEKGTKSMVTEDELASILIDNIQFVVQSTEAIHHAILYGKGAFFAYVYTHVNSAVRWYIKSHHGVQIDQSYALSLMSMKTIRKLADKYAVMCRDELIEYIDLLTSEVNKLGLTCREFLLPF